MLLASVLLFLTVLIASPTVSFPTFDISHSASETASVAPADENDQTEANLSRQPSIDVLDAVTMSVTELCRTDLSYSVEKLDALKKIPSSGVLGEAQGAPYTVSYSASDEEFEMLLYCLDHETHGSVEHRVMIAQVILNRVSSPRFPSTIKEVLNAPNQFNGMAGFDAREGWTPSDNAVTAARMVLENRSPDLARGAIYFCNPSVVGESNWFDQALIPLTEIEGHRFYK